MRLPALLIAASLVLAGCNSPQVYGIYYNSGYSPTHPQLAAANGDALAIIRANPFPEDRDNTTILTQMQGRNPGYKVYFTQTPRPDVKYDYRVILTFGDTGGGGVNACRDTAPPPPAPRGERIDMRADFCIGDILLSEARGSTAAVDRADDPRLNRLIGDVLTVLLSNRYTMQTSRCGMANC